MNISGILTKQILIMILYMIPGYLLFRSRRITEEGSRSIANLLVRIVIPATILNCFCVPFSFEKLRQFGVSALLALLILGVAMLTGAVVYNRDPVSNFAASFSNAGFIGIPLVKNCIGEEAVFYLVGMVVLLNCFQLVYSIVLFDTEKRSILTVLKGIVLNPIVLSTIVGLILFISGAGKQIPDIAGSCISGLSGMNAPLAMIVLGVYLARTNIKELFISPRLYTCSFVRLLLIPGITLVILAFLPIQQEIRLTLLIAAAAPAGANAAVYAQLYGKDYQGACSIVAQSTLLSMVTMPLLMKAAAVFIK